MKVTLDTNIFLNVKNKEKPYYPYSQSILRAIDNQEKDLQAIVSVIVITELCVGYYMNNELLEKSEFLSGLHSNKNYHIIEFDAKLADKSAEICSKIALKLPDCIIVASAITENSEILITNDIGFKKAEKFIKIYTSQQFYEKYIEDK